MKWIIRLALLVVVVVVAAVVGVFFYINTIAKHAVERGGTAAMGVPTTVDGVSIGVFRGEAGINGLTVANPQGYKTPHFMTMDDADAKVSLGTLRQDKVVIPYIRLDDLDINLEKLGDKANYEVILENLKKLETGQTPDPQEEKVDAKKYVIQEVAITNIKVHAKYLPLGKTGSLPTSLDVDIPEIRIKDFGSESDNGVVMSELTGIIVKSVLTAISKKTGGLLPPELLGGLNDGLSQLKGVSDLGIEVLGDVSGTVEGVTKVVGDVTKDAGKAVEDVSKEVNKIGEGIGNLLGGKKKEEK